MLDSLIDYLLAFGGALVLTLVLTPIVRGINRRLGIVDHPDARRINTVPIPRGGGLALYLGIILSYALFLYGTGRPAFFGIPDVVFWRVAALGAVIVLVGLVDDRYSLPPKIKLLAQCAVAFFVWWWAGLGFQDIFPTLPSWLDCFITCFWIVGAINAFNLIDGLDGLASGLALIATISMAGTLLFSGYSQSILFYLAFAGGLLGFLRYNYNPASVFLGDCGSMYIGFSLSVLPLCTHVGDSLFVSIGMPILVMGVPIFDTALAILRRLIRRFLGSGTGAGRVMEADTDHVHHRVLRSVGFNQRKAAWVLYLTTAFFVLIGLSSIVFTSKSVALWLFAFTVAFVVVLRDLARVELFDAGMLLRTITRSRNKVVRRRLMGLAVPCVVLIDVVLLVVAYVFAVQLFPEISNRQFFVKAMLCRVFFVFLFLAVFRVYRTAWMKAMTYDYLWLVAACLLGSVAGGVVLALFTTSVDAVVIPLTFTFALASLVMLVSVRLVRPVVRVAFHALECSRLVGRRGVSRVLIYGAGQRGRIYLNELSRKTAKKSRIAVGFIDDDYLLRGLYVGGVRVLGTLLDAPEAIDSVNADAVVIACSMSPERLAVVKEALAPTGVKLTRFELEEKEI